MMPSARLSSLTAALLWLAAAHAQTGQLITGPSDFNLGRFIVRFNADFFNVLNTPGLTQPDPSSGIPSLRNSRAEARQLQLTLRLTW